MTNETFDSLDLSEQNLQAIKSLSAHDTRETCLASKDVMSSDLLKKKLMLRLDTLGKTNEEGLSYIQVGCTLFHTEQRNLAFGLAASMVNLATDYSVVSSLYEAPK